MLRGARDPDAAGTVPDHGKDVHPGAVEEAGGEEARGQDPLCPRSRELGPPRTVAAQRRAGPVPAFLEDLPDRGRRHGDAQSRELAVDPPAAPGLILRASRSTTGLLQGERTGPPAAR